MEQQLILEKPDSWHWKVKVITVKSESDDWENESENSEKWKWLHNWPTYAHKMEQQLFLNQPYFWHWKVKVRIMKSESDDYGKW